MDYLAFLILFILLAGISAFCNAVFSSLSFEEFNIKTENLPENSTLRKLKRKYDDVLHSLGIWESIFFFLTALGCGSIICYEYFKSDNITLPILICAGTIILSVILRTFFYAIGRRYSEKMFDKTCSMIYLLYIILQPFLSAIIFLDRIIGGAKEEDDTRDELTAIVESAHEEGTLDADEYRIFKNVLQFSNVHVSDVMTPRTVLFSLQAEKTVNEIINHPGLLMYSRFPIWDGESLDDGAIGYVLTKDILQAALHKKGDKKLRDFSREVYFIPENAELDLALDKFLQRRQHLFMVVDEYGGIEGILTMEDVLETILGAEIVDEADRIVDLRELAKKRRDNRIKQIDNKNR